MEGIEKLITQYIYDLMKAGNDIMLFPDNQKIILNDEIEEWNDIHGVWNETDRFTFYNYREGYVIHRHGRHGSVYDILISMQDIQKGYEYFKNLPLVSNGKYSWWEV